MYNVIKNKKSILKTVAEQFKNPNVNIHLHFWSNGSTDLHSHEFFEIFLVTEGCIQHRFNDEIHTVSKNTLCLLRPGDQHQFLSKQHHASEHCNIRIIPSFFQTLCSVISSSLYEVILKQDGMIEYKLSDSEMEHISHYFKTAHFTHDHVSDKDYASVASVVATIFLLYFHSSLKTQQLYPEWFSQFLNKLNSADSFSKPLSALYQESGYSQTALNSYFKKYMGKTLVHYMIERKINYACNLLNTTDYSILQIAFMASFNNLSNFNAKFKKIIGITPTQYRQKRFNSTQNNLMN